MELAWAAGEIAADVGASLPSPVRQAPRAGVRVEAGDDRSGADGEVATEDDSTLAPVGAEGWATPPTIPRIPSRNSIVTPTAAAAGRIDREVAGGLGPRAGRRIGLGMTVFATLDLLPSSLFAALIAPRPERIFALRPLLFERDRTDAVRCQRKGAASELWTQEPAFCRAWRVPVPPSQGSCLGRDALAFRTEARSRPPGQRSSHRAFRRSAVTVL